MVGGDGLGSHRQPLSRVSKGQRIILIPPTQRTINANQRLARQCFGKAYKINTPIKILITLNISSNNLSLILSTSIYKTVQSDQDANVLAPSDLKSLAYDSLSF